MIYFLQPVDGGPVKIGFTDHLGVRHKQLEAHYGRPLALLATMEGGRSTEAEIHGRFAHLRFGRTEQFRPGPDLMAFINRPLLVDANPDVVEAMKSVRPRPPADPSLITVRFDRALVSRLKMIATDKNVSLAEYISEIIRPTVERDWGKLIKKTEGET